MTYVDEIVSRLSNILNNNNVPLLEERQNGEMETSSSIGVLKILPNVVLMFRIQMCGKLSINTLRT